MLSGIVTISSSCVRDPFPAQTLLRSLSTLVPGVVNGLLGDLTIACPRGAGGIGPVADHAGCVLTIGDTLTQAFTRALEPLRHDNVLVMDMRFAAPGGFHLELDELLQAGVPRMVMRAESRGLMRRLMPAWGQAAMCIGTRQDFREIVATSSAEPGPEFLARRLQRPRVMRSQAMRLSLG